MVSSAGNNAISEAALASTLEHEDRKIIPCQSRLLVLAVAVYILERIKVSHNDKSLTICNDC